MNSCITRATASIKHHQWDVFTFTGAQKEVGCLLYSPWSGSDTWQRHMAEPFLPVPPPQGATPVVPAPDQINSFVPKAVTPPPAPEALTPRASQANSAATRKGWGRGGSLQFKTMLTSFIQILTYGLILSKMPRAMRILSLVYNNTTQCQ